MSNNKYEAPSGPPPNYPPQVHHDAGPYYGQDGRGPGSPAPYQNQITPYQQQDQGYYAPQQEQYGGTGPQQHGFQLGPPPGGYYGQPQGGMYYQQQPPTGYFADNRGYGYGPGRGGSSAEGICAGLLGALACCCCLDFLI